MRRDAIGRLSKHKESLKDCLENFSVGLGSGHTVELDITSFDQVAAAPHSQDNAADAQRVS